MTTPESFPGHQPEEPDAVTQSVINDLIDRANRLADTNEDEDLPLKQPLPPATPQDQTTLSLIERFKTRRAQAEQPTTESPDNNEGVTPASSREMRRRFQ